MRTEAPHTNYVIQTVAHALDLLELFQESNSELGITDLSKRLHLHKNNVFRLVATLNSRNYIEKNTASGKYRLGFKTRALGHLADRQVDYRQYVRPSLARLNRLSRETCYFSMLSGDHAYYMDVAESDLPVRLSQWVGSRRSVCYSASGKVQLAFLPKEEQEKILAGLEFIRHTDTTITDSAALRSELERILQRGYAIEDQEFDTGVIEIAAPVLDSCGNVIGALSITGPSMRVTRARIMEELAPALREEVCRLSAEMSGSSH